jgi:hypothetical protein
VGHPRPQGGQQRLLSSRATGKRRQGGGVGGRAAEDAPGGGAPGAVGTRSVVESIAESLIGSGQPVQARAGAAPNAV